VTVMGVSTVMLRLAVLVFAVGLVESVTLAVKLKVPVAFGVPESTPLGLMESQDGLPLMLHV